MTSTKTRAVTMQCLYAAPARIVEHGETAEFDEALAAKLVESRQAVYADVDEPDTAELPARSALKKTWVSWAVEHGGMDESEAKAMTRDALAEHFHDGELADDEDEES